MMRGTKPGLWELPVLILLLAAPLSFLGAQPSLLNLKGAERRLLGPEMDLLVDENGALNFQDVLSGKYSAQFQRAAQAVPNFGFSGRVYWARLLLKNPGPSQEWLIQIAYPHLDSIKLYESSGRQWKASETGDMFPFRIRPLKHRTFFFPIHFERGETKTIYLRFQSQGVLEFPVFVMKAEGLLAQDHEEQFILGIYYGILLVLAVYNLILFFIVRDIAYLYYLLYISGYGTLQLVLNGLAFEYLWPDYPVWANYSLPFSVAWTFFWGIFFVRRLLSTRAIAPFSDQLLAILQTLLLIMMPAVFFISYHFAINAAAYVAILFALLVLAAGFICAIRGYEPARYFLVAWAAVLCGVLLYGLKAFAVLPSNFVTEYGLQFGSAVEMCLLSLGLANRMSVLEREKTKALQYSYEVERAHQEARILQARLETDLLKRNIQPHFIMNSINAVLVWLEEDPSSASKLLAALAAELRLLLDITGKKLIRVEEEIRLCRNHLTVMGLRHDKRFRFKTVGVDMDELIPPLTFHTILENALTHGFQNRDKGVFLIQGRKENGKIRYAIVNNGSTEGGEGEGTGMKYVRYRLEESFPGRWTIQVGPGSDGRGWRTQIEINPDFSAVHPETVDSSGKKSQNS